MVLWLMDFKKGHEIHIPIFIDKKISERKIVHITDKVNKYTILQRRKSEQWDSTKVTHTNPENLPEIQDLKAHTARAHLTPGNTG